MELAKLNFFEKLQNTTPIGLSSLGLKRKTAENSSKKSGNKHYPCFFKILPKF